MDFTLWTILLLFIPQSYSQSFQVNNNQALVFEKLFFFETTKELIPGLKMLSFL